MEKGLIVVLSGTSSIGKKRIKDLLLENKDLKLFYSISLTTRPPKADEIDGEDYFFVSHQHFADAVKNRELLEFTEFNGYYYGTPLNNIDFLINNGKNVLIEVEAQGVGQIRLVYPNCLAFFIFPESIEELEKQMRARYQDESSIQQRLNKAKMELELASLFPYAIKATTPNAVAKEIETVISKHLKVKE